MTQQVATLVKESDIMPKLTPKMNDLVQMVGEQQLKKEMSFAIQAVNANSYLQKATHESIAKCVWNIGITGLTLNPIHAFAYITPRSIGGNVEAIITPSYKGLVKLITDTGSIKNLYAHPVYKGDEFEVTLGTEVTIKHVPKFITNKSEDITHFYAVAILLDGSKQIEVMSVADVNDIRERSDSYKAYKSGKVSTCIWVDFYGEMGRKTVVKRLCKYLPKTERWEALQQAIELDNEDYPANNNQYFLIERLLSTSAFGEDQRKYIEMELSGGINIGRANKIIADLQNNQLDPITQLANPSATDIKNRVKEINQD